MAREKEYSITQDGTYYDVRTPSAVVDVLERCRRERVRVRVWYGDAATGRSWDEENETTGYIGRSTGMHKIPLLIHNARSTGGGGLLDHCVVKVLDIQACRILWQHPQFSQACFTVKEAAPFFVVLKDGEDFAPQQKTLNSAKRLADFMNGKRAAK